MKMYSLMKKYIKKSIEKYVKRILEYPNHKVIT